MTRQRSEMRELPWRQRVAKKGGRQIKDGPKLRLNWDRIQEDSTGQLVKDDNLANYLATGARDILLANPDLPEPKARRVRKIYNDAQETLVANRQTWCPTCINVLHNCICPPMPFVEDRMVTEVGVALIHRLRMEDRDRQDAYKLQDKLARRAAYKARKKAQKGKGN